MKLGKRSLVLAVALMLALSASVFGTIAYLTSSAQATNTFTVGDVEITLDETDVDENGNPKYPVDTDGDGTPDVEISIDENGTITVDPTPDDDTDDPIVIKPDENGKYPPTDIDGDGDLDEIEVGGGTITVTPEGGDPTIILPGDVTVDEDGTITIDPACPECEDIVIEPNADGTYPDTDVNGDGVKDKIEIDEDGNVVITDGANGTPIVAEPAKDNENEYNLVPGAEYLKDPTVTIKADSEECYVRMRVAFENADNTGMTAEELFDLLVKDLNEDSWKSVGLNADGEMEFWYVEDGKFVTVEPGKTYDMELPALFTAVGVDGTTTSEELKKLSGVQMSVYGDAIQAASFADAEEAWEAFEGQNG